MTQQSYTDGLGREDKEVLRRFPGIHERTYLLNKAGHMPQAIAGILCADHNTELISARWVESILRRLTKARR